MSHNCASEMPFVCKVVAGMDPPTTAAPPTINPPVVCSEIEQDWVKPNQESEYCYKFVAADSDQDTWKSSEDQCRAEVKIVAVIYFSPSLSNFIIREVIWPQWKARRKTTLSWSI